MDKFKKVSKDVAESIILGAANAVVVPFTPVLFVVWLVKNS